MRRCPMRSPLSPSMRAAAGRASVSAAWRRAISRGRTASSEPAKNTGLRSRGMSVCKTGADHIRSLKDGRTVYIDGELVGDVTEHPAFRNSIQSSAALYDFQAAPENVELMTFVPD